MGQMSALILTSEEREFLEILLRRQHSNYLNSGLPYSEDYENFRTRLHKTQKDVQLLLDLLDKIEDFE